jgi:hypothetical protein
MVRENNIPMNHIKWLSIIKPDGRLLNAPLVSLGGASSYMGGYLIISESNQNVNNGKFN